MNLAHFADSVQNSAQAESQNSVGASYREGCIPYYLFYKVKLTQSDCFKFKRKKDSSVNA